MANTDIASQLIGFLGSNPQLITQFLDHPYSTVQQATGSEVQLSQSDMSEVVTAAAAMSTGQSIDFGNLASVASALLGQNGNSVHQLTNALFGTSQQAATVQSNAQAQGSAFNLGTLMSLAGTLMSASNASAQSAAAAPASSGFGKVDLSDGIGLSDVIGIASLFMGK